LVLTANIGFQSRVTLLRILAMRGGVKDATNAGDLLKLLTRIEEGYADRNSAAHGVWSGTADPAVAERRSIRAKGNKLRCANDLVSLDQLRATAARLDDLRKDFAALLVRLNLPEPTGE
jgi:hypothetical protein